ITIIELLRVYLNKDSSVNFAAWKREHPTKNPILLVKTSGKTAKKAINEVRKIFIYYGDPENSHPNYQGQDADIYPEFQIRYENWRVQYAPMEEQEMMTKYSTCNAMVRDLIAKGEL
ncbi:MAG: hypothetical protein QF443_05045, partial [Dehalococcoidia bacterium]|nr:hypothetical protein [Dehalococcoidia bacterium]